MQEWWVHMTGIKKFVFVSLAIALTRNVPTPLNLGGIALKVKPPFGIK